MTDRVPGPGRDVPERLTDGGESPLFERFPDPIIRYGCDAERPVVRAVNGSYRDVFADVPGAGDDLGACFPPDRADEVIQGVCEDGRIDAEVELATAAGQRWFRVRTIPLGENPVGYAIHTDVTERRERERELTARNERLDEFARTVSHDLRNPLDVAKIRLEAAQDTGEAVHFEKAAKAHDRMEAIVEDVLTLARRGDVIGDLERVTLAEVIEAAWESIDSVEATLRVDPELPEVRADPDRLQELFENLFTNAVRYGGDAVTVAVGRFDDGFYVADDGPGIPDEDHDRVFESGYTTSQRGTGLGLSIVERIAQAHGWSVRLTESDAGGARFEFAV